MSDDIEHYRRLLGEAEERLVDLESGNYFERDLSSGQPVDETEQAKAKLRSEIASLERHIAALEKRKNA